MISPPVLQYKWLRILSTFLVIVGIESKPSRRHDFLLPPCGQTDAGVAEGQTWRVSFYQQTANTLETPGIVIAWDGYSFEQPGA